MIAISKSPYVAETAQAFSLLVDVDFGLSATLSLHTDKLRVLLELSKEVSCDQDRELSEGELAIIAKALAHRLSRSAFCPTLPPTCSGNDCPHRVHAHVRLTYCRQIPILKIELRT